MEDMTLTNYTPLLHKIANKFPDKYKEDLIQEGYLQLNSLEKNYNPELGQPFETYAYKRLYFSMVDYIIKEMKYISLDNSIEDEDGNYTTYTDLIESEEDLENDICNRDFYKHNLSQSTVKDRFIKERHFEEGMTPKDIVELYSEYHHIKDVRTIRKILKK